jgi:hypothetical protein
LNGVLRAAVSQAELPFSAEIKERVFPLKEDKDESEKNFFLNDLYSEGVSCTELIKERRKATLEKLENLCPEQEFGITGTVPENENLGTNIKVRHIQPMGAGAQILHRPVSSSEPDLQSRKSLSMLRKAFFEQTAKIFQPFKGTLIYDVMNPQIEKKYESSDGYTFNLYLNDRVLAFDSRFESGNLQLAIKVPFLFLTVDF